MNVIVSVIIGALITAVVGNYLVQRWQLGVWRAQQRQLGYQAELSELKGVLEEISTKSANRYNAMRRLISSLSPGSGQDSEEALGAYRHILDIWNGSLNSLNVRIRLTTNYTYSIRFEEKVHHHFRLAGIEIEKIILQRKNEQIVSWHDLQDSKKSLNNAKVASYEFLRDLTDIVEKRREEIYFGRKLNYSLENLNEYRFFELVKALFVSGVDGFYVIRSS